MLYLGKQGQREYSRSYFRKSYDTGIKRVTPLSTETRRSEEGIHRDLRLQVKRMERQ